MILTGTPVTNAPLDFWSQYRFLNPDILGTSFVNFKARYAEGDKSRPSDSSGPTTKVLQEDSRLQTPDELTRKVHSISYRVTKDEALGPTRANLPKEVRRTRSRKH